MKNTDKKVITRKRYLAKESTHREYYAQFVSKHTRNAVLMRFGMDRILKHFENEKDTFGEDRIPLKMWDDLPCSLAIPMESCGDFLTKAGKVCILKEAAKQLTEAP